MRPDSLLTMALYKLFTYLLTYKMSYNKDVLPSQSPGMELKTKLTQQQKTLKLTGKTHRTLNLIKLDL